MKVEKSKKGKQNNKNDFNTLSINSIKRIIDTVISAKKNKEYNLEDNDYNIFIEYKYYFNDLENNSKFFEETSKILLELKDKLENLYYSNEITIKRNKEKTEYLCSIEINKEPDAEYYNKDIKAVIFCSSEFDSMSRFEEIQLKKINEEYYILDFLSS